MKTKTINIYQFSELSETAKERALNQFSDINVDYEWWEAVYGDAANIGLKITGFNDRNVPGSFTLSACEVAANIIKEHGENCETYKTAIKFIEEWQPIFNDYMNEECENYESNGMEDTLNDMEYEFLRSLCEDYRIMLSEEYDYLTSKEAIIETIEANEYEFLESGKQA